MEKMSLREFLATYVNNMVDKMDSDGVSLSAMQINCHSCPFKDLCHDDDENEQSCEQFILSMVCDGEKYKPF